MQKIVLFLMAICIAGCKGRYDGVSDQDLSQRAKKLNLKERYDLYIDVYKRTFPHRTELAHDIVILGEPARRYTLERAMSDGYYSGLLPAIPILGAFDENCSSQEYEDLISAAKRTAPNKMNLQSVVGRIRIVCGVVNGTKYEDLNKAFSDSIK